MLSLLIKLFVKDSENTTDPKVRESYGVLCGGYGIFLNIVLFIGKYIAGVLSSSIAMTADAFNNLSDAGSSLISVVGFKLAGQKPDPQHPFGHGRIEYLSGLAVSVLIILMGYELVTDSFVKIIHPEAISFSWLAIAIMMASILVKVYMAFYCKRIGKKIDSATLLATSTDSLSDTISTTVVVITALIGKFFGLKLDGFCGLVVGLLIIWAGIKAAKETISPLLGQPPTKEFVNEIERIVLNHKEIVGIHDLIVHDYGPGRVMISLHAEVSSKADINEIHDVIDVTEVELRTILGAHAVIHMDPVEIGNPEVDELRELVKDVIKEYDESITFHDFRVVLGNTHTNLIFDVVVSFDKKETDEEIAMDIAKRVNEKNNKLFSVVNVDRDYVSNAE
ncbi:MAG: cation diffusion facilitator family transporter [Lachnospiraceae bacterium]|nr:cation diffusion facilitator family transporter [Lachnospiraceae bacterium]